MPGKKLPPNAPAENSWRARLDRLRQGLDALDAAMQAGQWEPFTPLAAEANQAMRDLLAHPGQPAPTDAEAVRQTLNLAETLQERAATRQQQILPLLQAWKTTTRADQPTP
jgi:hypothetical protein